jgi:hypothetical protein
MGEAMPAPVDLDLLTTHVVDSVRWRARLYSRALALKQSVNVPDLPDPESPLGDEVLALQAPGLTALSEHFLGHWASVYQQLADMLEGKQAGATGDIARILTGQADLLIGMKSRSIADVRRFMDAAKEGKNRAILIAVVTPGKSIEARFTYDLPRETKAHLGLD